MDCTVCSVQSYTFVAQINHRKPVKISFSKIENRLPILMNHVPQPTNKTLTLLFKTSTSLDLNQDHAIYNKCCQDCSGFLALCLC